MKQTDRDKRKSKVRKETITRTEGQTDRQISLLILLIKRKISVHKFKTLHIKSVLIDMTKRNRLSDRQAGKQLTDRQKARQGYQH